MHRNTNFGGCIQLPYSALSRRDCTLSWASSCRKHRSDTGKIELLTHFNDTRGVGGIDVWLGLEYFPYLVLGSRWSDGILSEIDLSISTFELPIGFKTKWLLSTPLVESTELQYFVDRFLLKQSYAPTSILEIQPGNNTLLYLPNIELLRSHYFFCPPSLPSLLSGLVVHRNLSSVRMQAWHYPQTCWIDQSAGIAQFHQSLLVTDYHSKCLSRLLFDPRGHGSLKRIHRWAMSSFIRPGSNATAEIQAPLPQLALPYEQAIWDASAIYLGSDAFGNDRYLILQIHSFLAPEPYRELHIVSDEYSKYSRVRDENEDDNYTSVHQLDLSLKYTMAFPIEIPSKPKAPVTLKDILPVDRASYLRRPIKHYR